MNSTFSIFNSFDPRRPKTRYQGWEFKQIWCRLCCKGWDDKRHKRFECWGRIRQTPLSLAVSSLRWVTWRRRPLSDKDGYQICTSVEEQMIEDSVTGLYDGSQLFQLQTSIRKLRNGDNYGFHGTIPRPELCPGQMWDEDGVDRGLTLWRKIIISGDMHQSQRVERVPQVQKKAIDITNDFR